MASDSLISSLQLLLPASNYQEINGKMVTVLITNFSFKRTARLVAAVVQ